MNLVDLSEIQRNVLPGSIMGDGEITKIYKNSRRKNNSYREHFSLKQLEYRVWKRNFMPNLLYINSKSNTLLSKSLPLFTSLYPYFYNQDGAKVLPTELLRYCNLPYFLATVYMDDGSLTISKRINHKRKRIYITPHISLYLQNYTKSELLQLQSHIQLKFNINFSLNKRKDGNGTILRLTSTDATYNFLKLLAPVTKSCPSMYYKTNWDSRFEQECGRYRSLYRDYEVISSQSDRFRNYTNKEVGSLIELKKLGVTDKEIALELNRSYWSVVYKLKEIRKDGLL
jgi:hypothetical protein